MVMRADAHDDRRRSPLDTRMKCIMIVVLTVIRFGAVAAMGAEVRSPPFPYLILTIDISG